MSNARDDAWLEVVDGPAPSSPADAPAPPAAPLIDDVVELDSASAPRASHTAPAPHAAPAAPAPAAPADPASPTADDVRIVMALADDALPLLAALWPSQPDLARDMPTVERLSTRLEFARSLLNQVTRRSAEWRARAELAGNALNRRLAKLSSDISRSLYQAACDEHLAWITRAIEARVLAEAGPDKRLYARDAQKLFDEARARGFGPDRVRDVCARLGVELRESELALWTECAVLPGAPRALDAVAEALVKYQAQGVVAVREGAIVAWLRVNKAADELLDAAREAQRLAQRAETAQVGLWTQAWSLGRQGVIVGGLEVDAPETLLTMLRGARLHESQIEAQAAVLAAWFRRIGHHPAAGACDALAGGDAHGILRLRWALGDPFRVAGKAVADAATLAREVLAREQARDAALDFYRDGTLLAWLENLPLARRDARWIDDLARSRDAWALDELAFWRGVYRHAPRQPLRVPIGGGRAVRFATPSDLLVTAQTAVVWEPLKALLQTGELIGWLETAAPGIELEITRPPQNEDRELNALLWSLGHAGLVIPWGRGGYVVNTPADVVTAYQQSWQLLEAQVSRGHVTDYLARFHGALRVAGVPLAKLIAPLAAEAARLPAGFSALRLALLCGLEYLPLDPKQPRDAATFRGYTAIERAATAAPGDADAWAPLAQHVRAGTALLWAARYAPELAQMLAESADGAPASPERVAQALAAAGAPVPSTTLAGEFEATRTATRRAAEAEAARLAAIREVELAAAEAAAAKRAAEADAARRAAEAEATRRAAELEAARKLAELEAARLEAARKAAEAEAARREFEVEAARRAAELEAEAARRAEELEATRREQEREAARLAEEIEAARRAAEALAVTEGAAAGAPGEPAAVPAASEAAPAPPARVETEAPGITPGGDRAADAAEPAREAAPAEVVAPPRAEGVAVPATTEPAPAPAPSALVREGDAPKLTGEAPKLTGESVHLATAAPKLTGESPSLATSAPRLTSETPSLATDAPKLHAPSPSLAVEAPRLVAASPSLGTEAPKLTGELPKLTGESVHLAASSVRLGTEAPKLTGELPKLTGELPKLFPTAAAPEPAPVEPAPTAPTATDDEPFDALAAAAAAAGLQVEDVAEPERSPTGDFDAALDAALAEAEAADDTPYVLPERHDIAADRLVESQPVTSPSTIARLKDAVNAWSRAQGRHPYGDLGDRIAWDDVALCSAFAVVVNTRLEQRGLGRVKAAQRPKDVVAVTPDAAGAVDPWSVQLPEVDTYAAWRAEYLVEGSETRRRCAACEGRGRAACARCKGDGTTACVECAGAGRIRCKRCMGAGELPGARGGRERCPACDGRRDARCPMCKYGKVDCAKCEAQGTLACEACNGAGESVEFETVTQEYLPGAAMGLVPGAMPPALATEAQTDGLDPVAVVHVEKPEIDPFELSRELANPALGAFVADLLTQEGRRGGDGAQGGGGSGDGARVTRQRLIVRRCQAHRVRYAVDGRAYELWVHGRADKVFAEDSPIARHQGDLAAAARRALEAGDLARCVDELLALREADPQSADGRDVAAALGRKVLDLAKRDELAAARDLAARAAAIRWPECVASLVEAERIVARRTGARSPWALANDARAALAEGRPDRCADKLVELGALDFQNADGAVIAQALGDAVVAHAKRGELRVARDLAGRAARVPWEQCRARAQEADAIVTREVRRGAARAVAPVAAVALAGVVAALAVFGASGAGALALALAVVVAAAGCAWALGRTASRAVEVAAVRRAALLWVIVPALAAVAAVVLGARR